MVVSDYLAVMLFIDKCLKMSCFFFQVVFISCLMDNLPILQMLMPLGLGQGRSFGFKRVIWCTNPA